MAAWRFVITELQWIRGSAHLASLHTILNRAASNPGRVSILIHQLLPSAPRFAFTTGCLAGAQELGLRASLQTFSTTSKAAQYRCANYTSKLFHELQTELNNLWSLPHHYTDQLRWKPTHPQWHPTTILELMRMEKVLSHCTENAPGRELQLGHALPSPHNKNEASRSTSDF